MEKDQAPPPAPEPAAAPIAPRAPPPPLLAPPAQCQDRALSDLRALARDRGTERLRLRDLGLYPGTLPPHLLPSYGVRPATASVTAANAHRLRFDDDAAGLPAAIAPAPASVVGDDEDGQEGQLPPATNASNEEAAAAAVALAKRLAALGRSLEVSLPPEEADRWGQAVVERVAAAVPASSAAGGEPLKPPTAAWLANHYRLVVWKLACLERAFPEVVGGRYLTRDRVVGQLAYRYVREVLEGQRPALRTVLNGDAPAGRLMVLCVSRVFPSLQPSPAAATTATAKENREEQQQQQQQQQQQEDDEQQPPPTVRVELTDGWYCVDAMLDAGLSALVGKGRIRVGTKLAVANANLQGAPGGVDLLEVKAGDLEARPYLRVAMNATRPARWDTPLGFQRKARVLPVPVAGLAPGGGVVSCLEAVVVRRYPTLYMERRQVPAPGVGGKLTRVLTEAEEEDAQRIHEAACQARMERLLEEEERKEQAQAAVAAAAGAAAAGAGGIGGASLLDLERLRLERQAKLEAVRRAVLEDPAFQRDARPFFRARLCAVRTVKVDEEEKAAAAVAAAAGDSNRGRELAPEWRGHCTEQVKANTAVLTVWDPSEALDDGLREGSHLRLYGATAPPLKGKGPAPSLLRLTASGNSCQVRPLAAPGKADPSLLAYARYEPRAVAPSIRGVRDKFSPTAGPFVARDFDAVGVHLASVVWELPGAGNARRGGASAEGDRKPKVTRLFFTDPSGCILCVEKRDYDGGAAGQGVDDEEGGGGGGGSGGSTNEVWALTDLGFQSYDAKTDTVLASLASWSGTRRAARPRARRDAYLREAMEAVEAWAKGLDGRRVIEAERRRLLGLLGGGGPGSVGSAKPRDRVRGSVVGVAVVGGDDGAAVLRLQVDMEGRGCLPILCRRQYALGRLAQAVLPSWSSELRTAGALEQALMGGGGDGAPRLPSWGCVALDLLVQPGRSGVDLEADDVEAGAEDAEEEEYELMDAHVVPPTQQALQTLNQLLLADTNFALLASSAATASASAGSAMPGAC